MGNDELTVAILREIRDELKGTNGRLDATNERLDRVVHEQIRHSTAIVALETRVGDLADGQRAIVSELVKLNGRVSALEKRVG